MAAGYLAAAAFIAAVFAAADGNGMSVCLRMLPVVFLLLLLFRTADDLFDYEKDSGKKPQPLTKQELTGMFCVLSMLCAALHLLLFGIAGLTCIVIIVLIPIAEKLPPVKAFYLAGAFLYYFALNGTVIGIRHLLESTACLLVSAVYAAVKRKKS